MPCIVYPRVTVDPITSVNVMRGEYGGVQIEEGAGSHTTLTGQIQDCQTGNDTPWRNEEREVLVATMEPGGREVGF